MAAFETSTEGSVKILTISGRLDPFAWRELKETLNTLTGSDEKTDLLVDLEKMDYMASSGFRELFLAGRQLSRNGGRLAVCSLQGEVKRIFELAKFETAYPIFANRSDALEFFQKSHS